MTHKLLTAVCALALVLGLSFSASAAVQNVKVGGDIEIKGIYQNAYDIYGKIEVDGVTEYKNTEGYSAEDLEDMGAPDALARLLLGNKSKSQDYLMSTVRVYVEASLTDNVSAMVRVLSERDWNGICPDGTGAPDVEIDLAYLTLDEIYGYPFSLTIGRQELLYGEGFLVGDGVRAETADTYQYGARKAFDAIKAVWNYDPHTIDLFTAKISEGYFNNIDADLYGINWNYDGGIYGLWDAGLFMTQDNPDVEGKNETLALSVRGEGTIPQIDVGTLALKGEVVKQWGKVAGAVKEEKRDAWGGYLEGEYTFDNVYAPYLGLGYIYMTGDDVDSEKIEAFDPMFEDERYGEIADWIYAGGAMTNAQIWKLSAGVNPTENTALDLTYYNLTANQEVIKDQKKYIGAEYDLSFTYNYSEDVTFGLMYALFNPGKFFKFGAPDNVKISLDSAQQLLGSVKVTF